MSPNTPIKQHHNLKIRPTYLIPMRSVENKDAGTTELRKDHNQNWFQSRDGRSYRMTLQGNITRG